MIHKLREALFASEKKMSELLFHMMTIVGSIVLIVRAVFTLMEGMGFHAVLGMLLGGAALVVFSIVGRKTAKYELCTTLMVLMLNVLVLPYSYIHGGGIHSGMPLWFSLGIIIISFLLRKKWLWITTIISVISDVFWILWSYYHPERVTSINTELGIYQDVCISFLVSTAAICMFLRIQAMLIENERRKFKEQEKALEEALQTQSRFLANMSHEIRTPINTIIGLNEMTLREEISDEVEENALNIQSASKILLSIINDILDLSKIESGKMKIVESRYELGNMCSDVVNMNWIRAHEKGLTFEVYVSEKLPSMLYGDELRIKQIINNLLSNAVKYTASGTVTLSIDGEITGTNSVNLKISVSDTGMGIKKDDLTHLFQNFQRINEAQTKGIEGTGLGLSITKQLTELMGGTITVDSVYHKGSTFTVTFEQGVVDAAPVGKLNYGERSGRTGTRYRKSFEAPEARVLVVDDNEMNLLVAKKLLRDSGVQLDMASSGKECLQLTLAHLYDVIFMDHVMPDMDGVMTMKEVRQQVGGLNRETPIVALTANAMSGAQEVYHKLGFSEYLAKPINGVLLESMLLKFLPENKVEYLLEEEEKLQPEGIVLKKEQYKSPVLITADSICDLPEEVLKKLDVTCINYYVDTEMGHFEENREIYADSLLEYIARGRNAYSEPPSVAEYEDFFGKKLNRAEHIIHISPGKKIGRGYERASRAANSFAHVSVVDSGHLSSGMGLVVMEAAGYAMKNMDVETILQKIEEKKKTVSTSFVLDEPESLYRNGRLSKGVYLFAKYFSLHPVLKLKNSRISLSAILMGDVDKFSQYYVRACLKGRRDIDQSVLFLTHAGVSREKRDEILEEVSKYQTFEKIYEVPASAAVSSNCGIGCFGLLYCKTSGKTETRSYRR